MMNFLRRHLSNLVIDSFHKANLIKNEGFSFNFYKNCFFEASLDRNLALEELHRKNIEGYKRPAKRGNPLNGKPFAKGIILRTLVKKPRKPNSANRKCVLVRLSIGKEMFAYVPGEGHNLQEHQTVLVKVGKLIDVPGVKLKCVRGKYDLPHVKKGAK